MKKWTALFIFCCPILVLGSKPHKIFNAGLNLTAFHQCKKILNKCPLKGPYKSAACIHSTVKSQAVCHQLSQLSEFAAVSADFINAVQFGNLTLITLYYPADGKNAYFALSPFGNLIALQIDPKKINPKLSTKYSAKKLFTMARSKPIYQKNASGLQQFIMSFTITKNCLACVIVWKPTVSFQFDAKGKFLKKVLLAK